MKKLFICSLLGLIALSSVSFASNRHVTGLAQESALAVDCNLPLDLTGIDFRRGEENVEQDAERKCSGKANRVNDFRFDSQCVRTHVWNATFVTVDLRADFECE